MTELKPCPFCGGKARVFETDPLKKNEEKFFVYGVICGGCSAHILKCSTKEAIEAWNRRG